MIDLSTGPCCPKDRMIGGLQVKDERKAAGGTPGTCLIRTISSRQATLATGERGDTECAIAKVSEWSDLLFAAFGVYTDR